VKINREGGEGVWRYLVDVGFGIAVRDRLKHATQGAGALLTLIRAHRGSRRSSRVVAQAGRHRRCREC
jgi:hypothetical protein